MNQNCGEDDPDEQKDLFLRLKHAEVQLVQLRYSLHQEWQRIAGVLPMQRHRQKFHLILLQGLLEYEGGHQLR